MNVVVRTSGDPDALAPHDPTQIPNIDGRRYLDFVSGVGVAALGLTALHIWLIGQLVHDALLLEPARGH